MAKQVKKQEMIEVARPGEASKLLPVGLWNIMQNKHGLEVVQKKVPKVVADKMATTQVK